MIVTVEITSTMIEAAREFAIKKQPTSYPRLSETKEEQLQRLFIGKLTELIGQEALKNVGIPHFCPDKLKVMEKMDYRDVADCIIYPNTDKEKSVDFKSAWQRYHSRILIPQDQYFTQKKDLYIGIKLHLTDPNSIPIFPNFKRNADVYGWIKWEELHKPDESSSRKFPAYWAYLHELRPLRELYHC
jgi:hypothetical protein